MRVLILVAMKVMPLLFRHNLFIPLSSIFIIMLMQITLIMCQAEIEGTDSSAPMQHGIWEMTVSKLVINKLKVWEIKTVIMTQIKGKLTIEITNEAMSVGFFRKIILCTMTSFLREHSSRGMAMKRFLADRGISFRKAQNVENKYF